MCLQLNGRGKQNDTNGVTNQNLRPGIARRKICKKIQTFQKSPTVTFSFQAAFC